MSWNNCIVYYETCLCWYYASAWRLTSFVQKFNFVKTLSYWFRLAFSSTIKYLKLIFDRSLWKHWIFKNQCYGLQSWSTVFALTFFLEETSLFPPNKIFMGTFWKPGGNKKYFCTINMGYVTQVEDTSTNIMV